MNLFEGMCENPQDLPRFQTLLQSGPIPFGVRLGMIWFLVLQFFSMMLTLLRLGRTSETDKDLEILILRQQLGIVQRRQEKPIKPNRAEKLTLAVLQSEKANQASRQPVSKPDSHLSTGNGLWLASSPRQAQMDPCQEKQGGPATDS